jgi:hypothetical protein
MDGKYCFFKEITCPFTVGIRTLKWRNRSRITKDRIAEAGSVLQSNDPALNHLGSAAIAIASE